MISIRPTTVGVRLLALVGCLGAFGCASARVKSTELLPLQAGPTSCAALPGADSTVYDTTQISERPVPRSVPPLEYPAEARRDRLQGRTVVTAVVNADGAVDPSSITNTTRAHALLDGAARRMVGLTTFWPACRGGSAVRAKIAVAFEFKAPRDPAGVGFAVLAGLWAGVMAAVMH